MEAIKILEGAGMKIPSSRKKNEQPNIHFFTQRRKGSENKNGNKQPEQPINREQNEQREQDNVKIKD